MKQTSIQMGMPITVEIVDSKDARLLEDVFSYFEAIDNRFSTYKQESEISHINNGLPMSEWSDEMKEVMKLSAETKRDTNGYFDIEHNGVIDPSGIVKGWAIWQAARNLQQKGVQNFYIEAGGDIQAQGFNTQGQAWTVGIRNPLQTNEVIKKLRVTNCGIATSGSYIRGQHIYNPHHPEDTLDEIVSLTVVADTVFEADRFATAAFAMGKEGIGFIEAHEGLEGYMVNNRGIATLTSGFKDYVYA